MHKRWYLRIKSV